LQNIFFFSFIWGISPVARQLVRHPQKIHQYSHNKIQKTPSAWQFAKLISRKTFGLQANLRCQLRADRS
jgi:hypothetical protein